MTNIKQAIAIGTRRLTDADIPEPAREATHLLMHILGINRTAVITGPQREIDSESEERFLSAIARRARREPFQYIVGTQTFYGLDFEVSPAVLVPRPETEIAVERVVELLRDAEEPHFLDVGTGSGCIAISVLHALSHATATGIDISSQALDVARRNAVTHGVEQRLALAESDLFSHVQTDVSFDVIVSNPPYIAQYEISVLQPEVRDHEPAIALTDGTTGLTIIKRLIDEAPEYLKSGGTLVLEIGFGQKAEVGSHFDPSVWEEIAFINDLQGIARTVSARLKR